MHGVTNLIAVKPRASATEVKSRIEAAFRRSAELDAKNIQVESRDGKVTLRGNCPLMVGAAGGCANRVAAPGISRLRTLSRLRFKPERT